MMDKADVKKIKELLGVTKVEDTIALSSKRDPFYPMGFKEIRGRWFADVFETYARPYIERENLTRIHVRGVHYLIQDKGLTRPYGDNEPRRPYVNDDDSWNYLQDASKYARELGLIDARLIVDKKTPTKPAHFRPADRYELLIGKTSSDYTMPKVGLTPFKRGLSEPLVYDMGSPDAAQPYYLEVWCEKSGPEEMLQPICKRYGATLSIGEGYNTITTVVNFIDRIKDYDEDKPILVFYISDHDPAGENMPHHVARHIEYWLKFSGVTNTVRLEPIMLTPEQVEEYGLPRKEKHRYNKDGEIEDTELERDFNARKGGYTEIDALYVDHPDAFRSIVTEALSPFYDDDLEQKHADYEDETREEIEDRYAREIEPKYKGRAEALERNVNTVVESFASEILDLQGRLNRALEPYVEEFESIESQHDADLAKIIAETEDEIELPEPEVEEPEKEWLFDSKRDYLEQLLTYRDRKPRILTAREKQQARRRSGPTRKMAAHK